MKADNSRIFVTGAGVLLPTGDSIDALWHSAVTGTSGITPYQSDTHSSSWLKHYGRVDKKTYDATRKTIPTKLRRLCSESTVWGIAAAEQALAQAGLGRYADMPERRGLFVADQCNLYPSLHSFGEWLALSSDNQKLDLPRFTREAMKNRTLPFIFLKSLRNNLLSVASSLFQCKGDCGTFGQDESASVAALRSALFSLRHHYCDQAVVIATGSYDEALTLCELYTDGYLSRSEQGVQTFCPYDRARNGMLLGEGSVALILENECNANRRGAVPLGEILAVSGQITSAAGRRHSSIKPYTSCLAEVLRDSRIDPYGIGVVCANGKGMQQSDLYELRSMEQALGPMTPEIPVTCSTPLTGMLGNVGTLVDVALSLLILKHGLVPPIAHLEDPELTALALCRDRPVDPVGKYALTFNMGLAGFHSAALIGSI